MAKALLHKAVGSLPWRDDVNYWLQRHVTHSLPVSRETFLQRAENAFRHLNAFRRYSQVPLEEARFFEFGAGWDLEIPLILAAAGVTSQVVVDRRRLLRFELVGHNLTMLRETSKDLEQRFGWPLRRPPSSGEEPHTALADRGIRYVLAEAYQVPFAADSFSFIHSTWTVEHIPEDKVVSVFDECQRLLAPGGVISCVIETQDIFSNFDRSISKYNYLRFSKRQWSWFQSCLMAQGRLRADDFYSAFAAAGLEVVEVEEESPPEHYWRTALEKLDLAEPFRGQPLERLAVNLINVVLRKK
ncbi:MAG: class I SAM-dependent methyltransferase [Acidobacteriota bacterium]|nr:class I SAM-dependent methyltransferase [Acidobacteriota bacterium]